MQKMDPMATMAGLLAGGAIKGRRGRYTSTPAKRTQRVNYFVEDSKGTVYYVNGKGTRRRATPEQIEEYKALGGRLANGRAAP